MRILYRVIIKANEDVKSTYSFRGKYESFTCLWTGFYVNTAKSWEKKKKKKKRYDMQY